MPTNAMTAMEKLAPYSSLEEAAYRPWGAQETEREGELWAGALHVTSAGKKGRGGVNGFRISSFE